MINSKNRLKGAFERTCIGSKIFMPSKSFLNLEFMQPVRTASIPCSVLFNMLPNVCADAARYEHQMDSEIDI